LLAIVNASPCFLLIPQYRTSATDASIWEPKFQRAIGPKYLPPAGMPTLAIGLKLHAPARPNTENSTCHWTSEAQSGATGSESLAEKAQVVISVAHATDNWRRLSSHRLIGLPSDRPPMFLRRLPSYLAFQTKRHQMERGGGRQAVPTLNLKPRPADLKTRFCSSPRSPVAAVEEKSQEIRGKRWG